MKSVPGTILKKDAGWKYSSRSRTANWNAPGGKTNKYFPLYCIPRTP